MTNLGCNNNAIFVLLWVLIPCPVGDKVSVAPWCVHQVTFWRFILLLPFPGQTLQFTWVLSPTPAFIHFGDSNLGPHICVQVVYPLRHLPSPSNATVFHCAGQHSGCQPILRKNFILIYTQTTVYLQRTDNSHPF